MFKLFFVFFVLSSSVIYGQGLQYASPQQLPSTINTPFEDTMPMLSAGGDTLYFTRIRPLQPDDTSTLKGHDIWYSVRTDGEWSEATNDLLNLDQFNGVVGVGGHGQTLYLLTYQNQPESPTSMAGIAYAVRVGNEWQIPQRLNFREVFTNNTFFGFFMSSNEQLLLISMRGLNSLGKEDLYVSFRDENNRWTLPKHLGPVINSRGYEISPYLSDDGKTLFFASNGHDGLGNADIFVAKRLDDSWVNWSTPKNLGKPINSAAFDAYFIEGKKNEVFFVSNRGKGLADIFRSEMITSEGLLAAGTEKSKGDNGESEQNGESSSNNSDSNASKNRQNVSSSIDGSSENKNMLTAASVYFEFNSDLLTDRAKYLLAEAAKELKEHNDIFIELVGYTDNVGSQRYNLKLSRKRAKAVQDFLVGQGIDKNLISTEGRGIFDVTELSSEEEIRQLQRKVDITYRLLVE